MEMSLNVISTTQTIITAVKGKGCNTTDVIWVILG